MGGNVRVGLEDSLFISHGQLAESNAQQVTKIRRIIEDLGCEIATPDEAREILVEESRVTQQWLTDAGVVIEEGYQHDMTPAADGKLPTVPTVDDLFIVNAGGAGAGWSAYIPAWAPKQHSRSATRRVRLPGDTLPQCGPAGCEIEWM